MTIVCIARRLIAATASACALGAAMPVVAGPAISYVPATRDSLSAYLVQAMPWQRARVVTIAGFAEGAVSASGTGRLVTLDHPISRIEGPSQEPDACGFFALQRRDIMQVLFRPTDGSATLGRSEVVEFGALVNLDGCEVGKETPFGSLADAGLSVLHRAMSLRAPMSDLVQGVFLAGMKEAAKPADSPFDSLSADVVKFLSGSRVRFLASGTVASATLDADRWLVLGLPGFQRGYTRLTVDPATGAETWLQAEYAGGLPVTVEQSLMVKPRSGASFGTVAQASRIWESGLFIGTQSPFFIYLFRDGTGDRVSRDLATGEETHEPITAWRFDGVNILQDRAFTDGLTRTRTWQPLANRGPVRFVMESEVINFPEGPQPFISPRVNFYVDGGRAIPSLARSHEAAPRGEQRPVGRGAPGRPKGESRRAAHKVFE